jgi:hypothetical protein
MTAPILSGIPLPPQLAGILQQYQLSLERHAGNPQAAAEEFAAIYGSLLRSALPETTRLPLAHLLAAFARSLAPGLTSPDSPFLPSR